MQVLTPDELFSTYHYAPKALALASTFGAISEESLAWLLQEGEIVLQEQGDKLFDLGDNGDQFFVILNGTMSYSKYHRGHYAYIRDYLQGQQVGFMSMIALHERVGKAVAKEQSITLTISSGLFHKFQKHAPLDFGILMMNLAREMARSLRVVDNLIVEKEIENS